MKYLIITLVISFLSSCKSTTVPAQIVKEEIIVESCRLKVSFFSPGNGIDHEIKSEFTSFLQEHYPKMIYAQENWGREGEIDFCFPLTELDSNEQKKFIASSSKILSSSSRVRIIENSPYRKK